ncbi:MAG: hypothetical protein IKP38_03595 [Clostridia bacterium]|nr:hypothetical protein [Clostridia bacterium]
MAGELVRLTDEVYPLRVKKQKHLIDRPSMAGNPQIDDIRQRCFPISKRLTISRRSFILTIEDILISSSSSLRRTEPVSVRVTVCDCADAGAVDGLSFFIAYSTFKPYVIPVPFSATILNRQYL